MYEKNLYYFHSEFARLLVQFCGDNKIDVPDQMPNCNSKDIFESISYHTLTAESIDKHLCVCVSAVLGCFNVIETEH